MAICFLASASCALQLLALVDQRLDAFGRILGAHVQRRGDLLEARVLLVEVGARGVGGERLDAAHAGGARRFGR